VFQNAFNVLVLGKPDVLGSFLQIAQQGGHKVRCLEEISEESKDAHPPPEVVIVAGEGPEVLTWGRKASATYPKASLLFVGDAGALNHIRSALPFVPGLGAAWTIDCAVDGRAFSNILADAGLAGRRRASHTSVMAGINRQLSNRDTEESRDRAKRQYLSETYFRSLIANSADAFIALTTDGKILALNDAGMRMFNVDNELAEMKLADALPCPAAAQLDDCLRKVSRGEEVAQQILPLSDGPNGEDRYAEFSFSAVHSGDKSVESISVTAREITDRISDARELEKKARALQESESNLRLLLDSTGEGFYAVNKEGETTLCNPAFLRLMGFSDVSDVIGRKLHDVIHHSFPDGSHYPVTSCPIYKCAHDGTPAHISDEFFYRSDGRAVPVEYWAYPILKDGKVEGAVCTCTDITERKQAEASLRELNETLEHRVENAIREREAAEEQLRQAQKMEAVGQLTGGIAHDFNNLLTVITGNMDMARRAIISGDQQKVERAVTNALKGADRAAVLTQRLLAFSRRQPLDPKPTDVGRLVSGMSEMLSRTLGERIQIETVMGAGLWRVEVDPHQLESAILNLAVNARDAMPGDGKLTIEASNADIDDRYAGAHAEVSAGQYVVIAVSDTGRGMDKETIERAFDPFFTTKEVGKGTGLGLSMVYGFVKQSGGHVKIYSEIEQGTTIKLYLPKIVGVAEEETASILEPLYRGNKDETVLVVEDDDEVRGFTVESLRELGYKVIEAHDGPSALRWLKSHEEPVQLILTDVVMPAMSGRELADAALKDHPELKVLFMTGYARNAIVHGGRLDPGVDLLPKPFTYKALGRKIREILDRESD
jgi:PAS domain S-box-containing protein